MTLSRLETLFSADRDLSLLLSSGQRIDALRFDGLVRVAGDAEHAYPLRGLAAFRRADGTRLLVRLDSVRVFEETGGHDDDGQDA